MAYPYNRSIQETAVGRVPRVQDQPGLQYETEKEEEEEEGGRRKKKEEEEGKRKKQRKDLNSHSGDKKISKPVMRSPVYANSGYGGGLLRLLGRHRKSRQ